jgi:hypothetical protein
MAAEIARRTGFGVVIASGFALEPDTRADPGRRDQVNRPTEGAPGRPPAGERASAEAWRVDGHFERRVLAIAGGPLQLYVELHGSGRRESAARIEVATVGLDADDAWRIRTLLELVRDARVGSQPGSPRLAVLVEPVERVRYLASGAGQASLLRHPVRALHIEIPRSARTEWRALYTDVLAQFVAEAALLFVGASGPGGRPSARP